MTDRHEPLKCIIPNPTAIQVRNAKRALYREWTERYGDEPYVMTAGQAFDAWEGCNVATIICRPALPPTMRMVDPQNRE